MGKRKKIIVAVTGASGSIYAKQLLDKLKIVEEQIEEVALLLSEQGKSVWQYELGDTSYENYPFKNYKVNDFYSPAASGSASYDVMIIIPCSMGTMGRIANGTSDDLIIRAADVMLKERRKLILVVRESPYNLIHIENMKTVTLTGGIICPASPSFYSKPRKIEDIVNTITERVMSLADFDIDSFKWGEL